MRRVTLLLMLSVAGLARADYQEAPVANPGTISGRITFNGRHPAEKTLRVTKDPKVCGASRVEDSWQVAEGGGVANVVVYLEDVASGKKFEGSLTPSLDQKGCHYLPHVQAVPLHSSLRVTSADPVLHNVHSFLDGATVINFAVPPSQGLVLTKKLDKPGGQQLKCDIHSFMRGGLFVAANPYYAITGSDGSYRINEVPPGTHTIATWHEEGGPLSGQVEVPASGSVTWNGKIR